MTIEKYIKRIARHTAVYWASPTAAQDGSNTYGAPAEIKCFWKEQYDLFKDKDGREVAIKAKVYVFDDLDEQGMLFLGTLADLTTAQKNDPRKVSRAYEISSFVKTPSLYSKGQFNRCAVILPNVKK